MRIGWIGFGNMGVPMVQRLLSAGYAVSAYARSQHRMASLSSQMPDVKWVESPESLAPHVGVLVLMVSDGPASQDILFSEPSLVSRLSPGTIVVNMSTIGVDETEVIRVKLAAHDIEYVDAPVLGSVKPATEGTLSIVVGGSVSAVAVVSPLFQVLGSHLFHLGPTGAGTKMKLLVNAMLGITAEAIGEILGIARRADLQTSQVFDVLATSAVWSPMLGTKRSLYEQGVYPAAFALKHMAKDLRLAQVFATQAGASIPAITQTSEEFQAAMDEGFSDLDMAGIVQHLMKES